MPTLSQPSRAVVLVSGGLDSAATLAIARARGLETHAVSVDYGQRHRCELEAAERVAHAQGAATHRTVRLDLRAVGGSALTDDTIDVPKRNDTGDASRIPVTYVPARNLTFLSIALGVAEVLGAQELHTGVNAVDYSGYPDCRPEFICAFERVANLATKFGVEGPGVRIVTPLIELSKSEIIRRGLELGVDFGTTVSCYDPDDDGRACGECDACRLRAQGFADAGVPDPTRYVTGAQP